MQFERVRTIATMAAIWGCLPMGWRIGLRGATGLVVSRGPRR
jgi:hypothetical protein